MKDLSVGEEFKVWWSNGTGYSIYRVVDAPGPHELIAVGHHEINSDGKFSPITLTTEFTVATWVASRVLGENDTYVRRHYANFAAAHVGDHKLYDSAVLAAQFKKFFNY
jgi:hypothetical protein